MALSSAEILYPEEVALYSLVERAARSGAVPLRRPVRAPSSPSEVTA